MSARDANTACSRRAIFAWNACVATYGRVQGAPTARRVARYAVIDGRCRGANRPAACSARTSRTSPHCVSRSSCGSGNALCVTRRAGFSCFGRFTCSVVKSALKKTFNDVL